jgi:hypothetical protein
LHRVRIVVAEEYHLAEDARGEKRVPGDGVEQEKPERDGESADDPDIGALAGDRMAAVRHERLREE